MTARLQEPTGRALALSVAGYQAESADNDSDANWLVFEVEVSGGEGPWAASAPALLTWGFAELVAWLNEVAELDEGVRIFAGLEPVLQFEAKVERSEPQVVAVFSGDLAPPGADPSVEHPVSFEPGRGGLRAFADSLAALAADHPVRAVEANGYARRVLGSGPA
jgi:hypothetical protein